MTERLLHIEQKLNRLRQADRRYEVFGSIRHLYRSEKVDLDDLEAFEAKTGITLPEDFRAFLLHIGTGAGPDYGIYSLKAMRKQYEEWVDGIDEDSSMTNAFELADNDAQTLISQKLGNPNGFYSRQLKAVNGLLPIQTEGV